MSSQKLNQDVTRNRQGGRLRQRLLLPLGVALTVPLAACGGSSSTSAGSSKAASASVSPSASSTSTSSATSKAGASGASGASTGSAKSSSSSKSASGSADDASVPKTSATNLSIPSIGLNHSIVPGGLSGGVLSPPPGNIIQFTGYSRVIPGQKGIAVLAGHVTYNGPDVFYALHSVSPGATFTIGYADGTSKKFVVTDKASVNKDTLQNDPRVWGSSSTPVVALITCDANSAWVNSQHHANNYVVWARPV